MITGWKQSAKFLTNLATFELSPAAKTCLVALTDFLMAKDVYYTLLIGDKTGDLELRAGADLIDHTYFTLHVIFKKDGKVFSFTVHKSQPFVEEIKSIEAYLFTLDEILSLKA